MSAQRTKLFLASGISVWFLSVVVSSQLHWLGLLTPYAIAATIAATIIVPVVFYFASFRLRANLEKVGLRALTAWHIWRIGAAFAFFWYGAHKLLPLTFTNIAGWGDFIAGVLALAIVLFWPRKAGFWVVHTIGMLDFVTAVGTGLTFTILDKSGMTAVTEFPLALIPFFGVGLSGASHVVAFHLLASPKNMKTSSVADRTQPYLQI